MDWLTKAFAQYSVAWLVLSTVAGVLSGVLSVWWTYHFRKKEIVASVIEDIKKQRQIQAMAQEKEREDRIRNAIIQWANPILGAVEDLDRRLKNILYDYGYLVLDKNKQGEINPNWSVTYEYFTQSTLYLFAQYFAWIQMLREQLSFELFRSEQTKDDFFTVVDAVSSALGSFPHPALKDCSGKDRQVFRLQQRVIGELVILRDSDPPRCMSYSDFLQKSQEETFKRHLELLRALLENVSPNDNCRWKRLKEMQKALGDLKKQCHQVLKLPEELMGSLPK